MKYFSITTILFVTILTQGAYSQSTSFTYQGNLTTAGAPANGNHDFEFALFSALSGGSQLGTTLTRNAVAITNGTFTVQLDFGNQFSGANRFLEIRVRPSGGGAFTTLSPRDAVSSAPYSVRSLDAATSTNATNLNGQPGSFYTNASNLSTGTVPIARFGNAAILNQSTQQPSSNFNVSGNGTIGGTLSVSAGSAATPSVTFGGDTNSGVFSAGADTLGFSTAGLQRIRITSTGLVGVGTSVPSARLTVNGIGTFTSAGAARFDLTNPTTGATSYSQFVDDNGLWRLSTTAGASRLSVSPTGNVGVGTDSPAAKLHVNGNSTISGNINVSGEVHRPVTGTANLVPICYGSVLSTGSTQSGSGNFTVSRFSTGTYHIVISGEAYDHRTYPTVVTVYGDGFTAYIPSHVSLNIDGNPTLRVFVHNTLSQRVDEGFSFVVYKP